MRKMRIPRLALVLSVASLLALSAPAKASTNAQDQQRRQQQQRNLQLQQQRQQQQRQDKLKKESEGANAKRAAAFAKRQRAIAQANARRQAQEEQDLERKNQEQQSKSSSRRGDQGGWMQKGGAKTYTGSAPAAGYVVKRSLIQTMGTVAERLGGSHPNTTRFSTTKRLFSRNSFGKTPTFTWKTTYERSFGPTPDAPTLFAFNR